MDVFGMDLWYEFLFLKGFSNGKSDRDAAEYFLTLTM
jgi:hypothetical protein